MARAKTNGDCKIELLADHPEAIATLKGWFESDWAAYYGPSGPGDAEQDLIESCSRDKLPIAVVAFLGDAVCGTAALKVQSVTTHRHLTPWLAALLVGAGYRRRGIAEMLIRAVEQTARHFGYARIYVGTDKGAATPDKALRKRGWVSIENGPYLISEVSIFKKEL